ncbi:hypothetical protein CYMTET_20225 [Cymbomonas tetramitiformis]|uniref:Uncharacterized protein n=1 Tax=Cymbomonas tetramitiformis TaxID=36881 RepID=A0AAE0L4D7_9CHLO|nr:hypothetical protein CYMTET_20225 [Cymbomonas tetramitiformis]
MMVGIAAPPAAQHAPGSIAAQAGCPSSCAELQPTTVLRAYRLSSRAQPQPIALQAWCSSSSAEEEQCTEEADAAFCDWGRIDELTRVHKDARPEQGVLSRPSLKAYADE